MSTELDASILRSTEFWTNRLPRQYKSRRPIPRYRLEKTVSAIERRLQNGNSAIKMRHLVEARHLFEYLSALKRSTHDLIASAACDDRDLEALRARTSELQDYLSRLYPLFSLFPPATEAESAGAV